MIQGVIYSKSVAAITGAAVVIACGVGYFWSTGKDDTILAETLMRQETAKMQADIGALTPFSTERLREREVAAQAFRDAMFTESSWKTFSAARFSPSDWSVVVTTEVQPSDASSDYVKRNATLRYNASAVSDWYGKILATLRKIQGEAIGITTIDINTTGSDQQREFEGVVIGMTFFQHANTTTAK